MATDIAAPVTPSSSNLYAYAYGAITVLFAALLKFLLDASGRTAAAQAAAHAGEKASLLTLYQQQQGEISELRQQLTQALVDLAALKQRFDDTTSVNAQLQVRIVKRERQVKQLADELAIEKDIRLRSEIEADQLRVEVNALCDELQQPRRYPTPTTPPTLDR